MEQTRLTLLAMVAAIVATASFMRRQRVLTNLGLGAVVTGTLTLTAFLYFTLAP